MTGPGTLDELRHRRDHHARLCASLTVAGRQSEAMRHARESERWADQIRARLEVSS